MAFFEEFSKKAKDVAAIAADKAKDTATVVADKAKVAADTAKINLAIAGEQRSIEKNYRAIGEWFINEYDGELPEGVKDLADAVAASKAKIVELEASKPAKSEPEPEAEPDGVADMRACPICGALSDSKFCPQCGAPME